MKPRTQCCLVLVVLLCLLAAVIWQQNVRAQNTAVIQRGDNAQNAGQSPRSVASIAFAAPVNYSVGAGPNAVTLEDFNRDGSYDLATANLSANTISVLSGNSNGTFNAAVALNTGSGPYDIAAGDMTGDRKVDLITTNSTGNNISRLNGNGTGGFGAATSYSTGASSTPRGLLLTGLNTNLEPQIAYTANNGSNSVGKLVSTGSSFSAVVNYTTGAGTNPSGLDIGTVEIGGADAGAILTADTGNNKVSVLVFNTDGSLQAPLTFNVGTAPRALTLADFNRDGITDVATANSGSNNVSLLLGNATSTFLPAVNFAVGTGPRAIKAADFNGDTVPDLVVTNYDGNSISLLRADGNGGFAAPINISVGTQPASVAAADVNGDGKPDLVVANFGSNNVSVLINTSVTDPPPPPPPPSNDNFANALVLAATGSISRSNVSATKEPGEPNHAGNTGGASVWHKWHAAQSGGVQFTCANFNSCLLAAYTGTSVAALTPVAASTGYRIGFRATANTDYYIAVDGQGGASGNYTLSWSGAAANDEFANATTISGASGGVSGDVTYSTREPGEPNHAGRTTGASVWYKWTAPATGRETFNLSPAFIGAIAVYTGADITHLTALASSVLQQPYGMPPLHFNAVAGTTYYLAVDGPATLDAPGTDTFSLTWLASVPPGNDNFANAFALSGSTGSTGVNTREATKEAGEPDHAGVSGGASVWYKWIAPSSSAATFKLSTTNLPLAVYTGNAVNNLTLIASDFHTGASSQVTFLPQTNGTYYIAVDAPYGIGASSSLSWLGGSANDAFANAQVLSGNSGVVSGSNYEATKEAGEPNHAGNAGGSSIWYRWTAPANGSVFFNTSSSSLDTLLGVYTGASVGALTPVASNDDSAVGYVEFGVANALTSSVMFNVTAGTVYQIAVDGYQGGQSTSLVLRWGYNAGAIPAPSANGCVPLLRGVAAWFPADGASNNLRSAHLIDNGDISSGVTFAPGVVGEAFSFDGTDDRVTIANNSAITVTGALSIDAWVRPTQLNQQVVFVSKYDFFSGSPQRSYFFGTSGAGGRLRFVVYQDGNNGRGVQTNNEVITPGVFAHVAATFDPATQQLKIYVNGLEVPTTLTESNTVTSLYDSPSPVNIGAYINGSAQYAGFFSGLIDEVQIFRRALSAAEVQSIYNAGTAGVCKNDAGIYPTQINGSSGSLVDDNTDATTFADSKKAGNVGGASLWYLWRAPSTGTFNFTTAGSNFDTLLAVEGASNDDAPSGRLTSSITFDATAGVKYLIAVDGYNGQTGNVLLSWAAGQGSSTPVAPLNDNFANGQAISGTSGRVTGTLLNATKETGEPLHAALDGHNSIWFRWVAPASGTVFFDTKSSNPDTVLAIYTGTSVGALSLVAANDDATPELKSSGLSFTATAGTEYRIAVDAFRNLLGADGKVLLNWSVGSRISGRVVKPLLMSELSESTSPSVGSELILSGSASRRTITDSTGRYTFDNLPVGGSYTVSGGVVPTQRDFPTLAGIINDADFASSSFSGASTGTITGRVRTAAGVGVAGITVNGRVTLGDGSFILSGLALNQQYTITPVPQTAAYIYTYDPPSITTNLTGDLFGLLFTITSQQPLYDIGGQVRDGAGQPMSGVTISLTGAQVTPMQTDANGNYSFDDLPGGTNYSVSASKAGATFTPPTLTFNNLSANQKTADFTGNVSAAALQINTVSPPAGRTSGGQQISLTGAFAGLATVNVGGTAATWSYTNGAGDTTRITVTTPAHAVGAVSIDLAPTSGSGYTKPNAFAYLPTVFTDNTLVAGVTTAKAQHITELRQAVDAMRAVAGLAPTPWTDPVLTPFASGIKAVHILELRTYLEDAASRLGYAPGAPYTDPGLGAGTQIKRMHIEELRQRIRTLAG